MYICNIIVNHVLFKHFYMYICYVSVIHVVSFYPILLIIILILLLFYIAFAICFLIKFFPWRIKIWWSLWTYYYLDSDLLVYMLLCISSMPIIKSLFLFISCCLLYILVRGWKGVGGLGSLWLLNSTKMGTEH